VSAEKVAHTPGHYVMEGTVNGKPFTREFVAIEDYNALQAHYADLLALAKRYASECPKCGGTGLRDALGPDGFVTHTVECAACADIRLVVEKAEGRE
jgi:hypothetical protein